MIVQEGVEGPGLPPQQVTIGVLVSMQQHATPFDAWLCRWMGEARFTVGGIREIMSGRFYPVRIAFLPAQETSEVRALQLADHNQ